MKKKIVGLSCGRKDGNSEIFLKTALMGAEESGIETEIIRLMDHKVLPCDACGACLKTHKCVKDDVDWILENTMLSDGAVIVSAPVYHVRTNGYLLCVSEKINHLFGNDPELGERKRLGAIISVGGSGYDGWTSLGLTTIALFTQHFTRLVDQVQINHCADHGAALTPDNQWAVDRCREMGRNMAKAMNMPLDEVKYVGEDTPVSCPVCHCNIMYFENDYPEVACPVCRVHGKFSVENNKYKITWNEKDIENPRFSTKGQRHHMEWIMNHMKEEHPQLEMPETKEKIEFYKSYGNLLKK